MRAVLVLLSVLLPGPALAISGPAESPARSIVMISGARGSVCTATAIARDLIVTSAHCTRLTIYRITAPSGASFQAAEIATHPRFDAAAYDRNRATADVALIKLSEPLPASVETARLGSGSAPAVGARMSISGFGVTASNSATGLGVPRGATLTVTGKPGALQVRLYDPATRNERTGLGACDGDSGGPAFSGGALSGIISWSTAPGDNAGCGGLTGVTPLGLYRGWIVDQARKMGSPVGP